MIYKWVGPFLFISISISMYLYLYILEIYIYIYVCVLYCNACLVCFSTQHRFLLPGCRCMACASSEESAETEDESERQDAPTEKPDSKAEPKEEKESSGHRGKRRRRHTRSRDRDRGRRRDSKSPSARRETSRREMRSSVPEPLDPPRSKQEDSTKASKGKEYKGAGKKRDFWICLECGQKVAPYKAAMEQHKHLNEHCIACQQWNRLPKWEQNEAGSWPRCKHEARGIKYGRQTELAEEGRHYWEEEGDRDRSPAWSLRSAAAAASSHRDRSVISPVRKENMNKKSKGKTSPEKGKKERTEKRDSSPEKPKKKKKKEASGSSEPSDDKRKSSAKRSGQVVINIH